MLKNYIKIAFKVMLRRKYYTFLALVGISFTIMIATMAAAFIDQLVGTNPAEPNRNRTLIIKDVFLFHGDNTSWFTSASLDFAKKYIVTLKTPEKVSLYKDGGYVSVLNKIPRSHRLKYIDENFWAVTNFKFIEGRKFNSAEIKNARRVIIISDELKGYYFNNGPAIGKPITVYGKEFRIIGVVKAAPLFSDASSDAWIPYTADVSPAQTEDWPLYLGSYKAMVLARSTDDFKAIRHEITSTMKKIVFSDPKIDSIRIYPFTAVEQFAKLHRLDPEPSYGVVLGAITICLVLFMLIPVISLINLNISRMSERSAEIGIRKSFGASSLTLTGQFIVENIILTITGGILGLVLAFMASDGLIAIMNTFDPLYQMSSGQFILSWRVFVFCMGCCLFFGFISGVYPAFRMSRLHPVKALKGESI